MQGFRICKNAAVPYVLFTWSCCDCRLGLRCLLKSCWNYLSLLLKGLNIMVWVIIALHKLANAYRKNISGNSLNAKVAII